MMKKMVIKFQIKKLAKLLKSLMWCNDVYELILICIMKEKIFVTTLDLYLNRIMIK